MKLLNVLLKGNTKIDKSLSIIVSSIWFSLALFWIVSMSAPSWLNELSENERYYEASLLVNRGIVLSDKGEYQAALDDMDAALKILPNHIDALINLGVIHKLNKDYSSAINYFNKALKLAPYDSSNIYANLLDIYKTQGDSRIVKYCLEKTLTTNPSVIERLMKEGVYYLGCADYSLSLAAFEKALFERFDISNYYKDMLHKELKSKMLAPDEKKIILEELKTDLSPRELKKFSIGLFHIMLNRDKGLAENYNKTGFAYARLNNFNKASECFVKALSIWPDYPDAISNYQYVSSIKD